MTSEDQIGLLIEQMLLFWRFVKHLAYSRVCICPMFVLFLFYIPGFFSLENIIFFDILRAKFDRQCIVFIMIVLFVNEVSSESRSHEKRS